MELVQQLGIRHFVYSTYWVNTGTVPLITAVQMQQAWSRATSSVLLAANIGFGYEDSGSGLYVGGTAVQHVFLPKPDTSRSTLLVAELPATGPAPVRPPVNPLLDASDTQASDTPSVPSNATIVPLLEATLQDVVARYEDGRGQHPPVECHLQYSMAKARVYPSSACCFLSHMF